MKTIAALSLMMIGFAASVMAAEFKGFVMDEKCSTVPAMKGDKECALKCVKGGSPAVLVTDAGKVYKIANQAKVMDSVGQTVTLNAKLKGDTLTVASVK